ncbi:hypothetical protein GIB67_020873 [Kingdonia uniflora]|uniref:Cleavage and polyadenylation specificity factor subunit 3-II n=1 Tax=Kingdonia uniflora TaxID=39325 RepID=A0A7J7M7K5_9MAGN|nr:hypothetical protein GIB67_020873 [Kingdonia uniflora]
MQSSSKIECLVLGAGQEVGKSCVVVTMGGKRIMFDCGMHMGHQNDERYPDFSKISNTNEFDKELTCIIITHFHLDHIGALAYFTEVCGYNGPIYMTYPTKALAPLMLEDYRKVMVERRSEQEKFSSDHIIECMKKVTAVDLKQTVQVDKDLQIRAYYAGHVIGAAMFYAKVGDIAIVYTGDYNMTPDRHLGAAQIDRLQLDLVITESTYGKTTRGSKYVREREFLSAIDECVTSGGKVLVPTFALGRAQELLILLEDYWERKNLKVPIYLSSVRSFDRSLINAPGPCVLFATPGMIGGGFSLEVFKHWAPLKENLITLPGYCMAGTIGHKLMAGDKNVFVDKDTKIAVRCKIHQLAFSPHTDAKGIMDLVRFLSPKNVILVHGDKLTMTELKERIKKELCIDCYDPANNTTVHIPAISKEGIQDYGSADHHDMVQVPPNYKKIDATERFIESSFNQNFTCLKSSVKGSSDLDSQELQQIKEGRLAEGLLIMDKTKRAKVVHQDELLPLLGVAEHTVQFSYCCSVNCSGLGPLIKPHRSSIELPVENTESILKIWNPVSNQHYWLHLLYVKLSNEFGDEKIQEYPDHLRLKSLCVSICSKDKCPYRIKECAEGNTLIFFCCSWSLIDAKLSWKVLSVMENLDSLCQMKDVQA